MIIVVITSQNNKILKVMPPMTETQKHNWIFHEFSESVLRNCPIHTLPDAGQVRQLKHKEGEPFDYPTQ